VNQGKKILRVAIIGPESSGKSLLCEQLARYFNTVWVKEYAREYLTKLGHPYEQNDISKIYNEQFRIEQELLSEANKIIFTDTEFIIAKVWFENVYGNCPDEIESAIKNFPYDLYLLTADDLPWEYDPLRENPGKGKFFFDWYVRILNEYKLHYKVVSGKGKIRLQNAIEFVHQMIDDK